MSEPTSAATQPLMPLYKEGYMNLLAECSEMTETIKMLRAENDMLFDRAAKRLAEIYELRAENVDLRRALQEATP